MSDEMVLHALTLGLDQDRLMTRLFESDSLKLENAICMCRLAKDTEAEMRKLHVNEEVSAVYKRQGAHQSREDG